MIGKALSVLAAAFLLAAAWADPIDDLVRAAMAKDHIPGVAVGVIKDSRLVVARGYGIANLETGTPVTPDTVFRIGSMSKAFTAAAILMLAEKGKLSIEDPVSKWVDDTPKGWKGVRLRHLLGHQSGIPEINDAKGYDFRDDLRQGELLRLMAGRPVESEPGARFAYSNSNYALLGWAVQKASGRSLKEFVEGEIFSPAAMAHTRYFRQDDVVPNRADAYRWIGDHYENGWPERSAALDGSGAVLTTLGDWARWDAALDTGAPVSRAVQLQMGTAGTFDDGTRSKYGFGLYVDGGGVVHHTGSTYGFTSAFIRDPVNRLTVVVLRNSNGGSALEMANAVRLAYDPTLKPVGRLDVTPPPGRTLGVGRGRRGG